MDKKRNINRMIKIMIIGIIILMIAIFSLNIYVVNSTKNEIVKEENVSNIEGVDCILILGAGIWGDKPSPMLEDRLKEGITLYKKGTTKKIIMSGDHSREDYDEVKIMKEYAESEGVPSEDIFMDHAGFSSYDSVYRAKERYGISVLIDVLRGMVGPKIINDKLNQLRHVEYFNKIESIDTHMQKQASLLKPKFEAVLNIFERELEPLGIAEWTKPLGGYFISFMAMENCAKAIVQKCKEAGTLLTTAGATYPYGQDPHDANIRIAPSFPKLEELKQATELFVLCVKLISVEKLLEKA